ncbi:MAG: hypothetical protein ACRD0S_10275, partial [Acidimicrobiales bacterium]
ALAWAQVPDPSAASGATRYQVTTSKELNGGEGAWFDTGKLYFTTKGDNRVWTYDPVANQLTVIYDRATSPTPDLSGVDNVTVSRSGDVFVAEDGGNMELVILSVEGDVAPFLRLGVSGSEITGPAFDPSGTRLYFSSQRNPGRTYEISGPFRGPGGGTTTSTTTTTTTLPGVALTARAFKVKGKKQVELSWSPAVGGTAQVKRNGQTVATVTNDGSHIDSITARGGGTFTYQVCEVAGLARCSNEASVTF